MGLPGVRIWFSWPGSEASQGWPWIACMQLAHQDRFCFFFATAAPQVDVDVVFSEGQPVYGAVTGERAAPPYPCRHSSLPFMAPVLALLWASPICPVLFRLCAGFPLSAIGSSAHTCANGHKGARKSCRCSLAAADNWPTVEPYFNETGSNSPS